MITPAETSLRKASFAQSSETQEVTSDALEARLFGSPHLLWQGEPLQLSSQKGRALLYLLAVRSEGVTRDELAELLWGVGKHANLRQALYQLRQLPGAARWLRFDEHPDGQERVGVKVSSDVGAFWRAGRAGRYREALALSDAPLLAGVRVGDAPAFNDWLEQCRVLVEEERRAYLQGEAARLERAGDLAGALTLMQALTQQDPLDEANYRTLMRLHYRQGDLNAAKAQFAECRRVLLRELGVEPLAETLELAHLIDKSRSLAPLAQRTTLPLQLLRPPHLVGREEVWAQMSAAQRAGKLIFLAGAAGIGKTRLMSDFARRLGSCVFNEARPGDVHSPYIVLARGLRRFFLAHPNVDLAPEERLALARLLPQDFAHVSAEGSVLTPRPSDYTSQDRGEHARSAPYFTPSPLDTPSKHLRFTEAVTSLFERVRRSVAALPSDDIHYVDYASHVLMAQVFQQLVPDQHAATLLVSYRPEETPPSFEHYLAPLLESGAGVRIELAPLSVGAVAELVESLELPGGLHLARRLHRYAGGNPMLSIETLKSMVSSGDLSAAPMLDLGAFNQASALLRRRLEALSSVALRVVRAKALTRDELDVHALAELVEMSPLAVAEGLEELEHAQVVAGEHFVHDLIYEAILAGIPATLARVLHERAALILAQRPSSKPERVAHHWLRAGNGAKAAPYLLQAALCARQIRADQEAQLRYFQVLWCTSADDVSEVAPDMASGAALRKRALRGLGTLAELMGERDLRIAVLRELESSPRFDGLEA